MLNEIPLRQTRTSLPTRKPNSTGVRKGQETSFLHVCAFPFASVQDHTATYGHNTGSKGASQDRG
jgi:hypothetical protein